MKSKKIGNFLYHSNMRIKNSHPYKTGNFESQENLKAKKITGKTKLSELMGNEKVVEVLFKSGMGCMGCPMAMQETLEQGCRAHGMSEKEINKLIEGLNK